MESTAARSRLTHRVQNGSHGVNEAMADEQGKQEGMVALMKEILQDDYTQLSVKLYSMTESLEEEEPMCKLTCHLVNADGTEMTVESTGVGVIDALFNGLRIRLADDYPSLKSIRFSQFNIRGLISVEDGPSTSKAEAEATVGILNSEGVEFIFKSTAPSVSRAGIQATVNAAEYFINSERTFVRLHEILEHYRSEGRMDLVEKYTELMSRVVDNTSYSEVVERIKDSM